MFRLKTFKEKKLLAIANFIVPNEMNAVEFVLFSCALYLANLYWNCWGFVSLFDVLLNAKLIQQKNRIRKFDYVQMMCVYEQSKVL